MNSIEPPWEHYRTFRAILAERSLSGAARALGLTQPTVARHLDALEQALGYDLFIRSQRGLSPTDAALALVPFVDTLAATAAALLRAASGYGTRVRGTVRISASEVMGVEVLPPLLAALRAQHPELVVELALSNAVEDLLRREADVAVRMVQPTQAALIAQRVGAIDLGFHAHRTYLERKGTPETLADLAHHDLIGFDRETATIRAMRPRVPTVMHSGFALRADSDLAQLAAIRAGFGIGICQVPLAARTPELVRLLVPDLTLALPTYVVMHEDLRANPACRAVFDALATGLRAHATAAPAVG